MASLPPSYDDGAAGGLYRAQCCLFGVEPTIAFLTPPGDEQERVVD
jgi:hypothetical protein